MSDDKSHDDEVYEEMLRHLESNPPPRRKPRPRVPKAETPPPAKPAPVPTLMLRHMTEEAALGRLEHFLRLHRRHGTPEVRVIVGKGSRSAGGESVLRPAVRRFCESHPGLVRAMREAPPELGGAGSWILELEPV